MIQKNQNRLIVIPTKRKTQNLTRKNRDDETCSFHFQLRLYFESGHDVYHTKEYTCESLRLAIGNKCCNSMASLSVRPNLLEFFVETETTLFAA